MSKQQKIKVQQELAQAIMIETGQQVSRHTCQLFYVTGNPFEPRGTGVLIAFEERYFLVSAGHVLKCLLPKETLEHKSYTIQISIPNGEDLITISGQLKVAPDWGPDIAIMEMEKEAVDCLKDAYSFFPLNRIGIGHQLVDTKQYLVSGFPIEGIGGAFEGNVPHIKARYLNLSTQVIKEPLISQVEKWQMALSYNRGAVTDIHTGEKITGPIAKGLSGSGIWFTEIIQDGGIFHNYKLVGIATDHVEPYDNIIIATRIDIVTEILRQKFGLDIPKSTIIKVNLD